MVSISYFFPVCRCNMKRTWIFGKFLRKTLWNLERQCACQQKLFKPVARRFKKEPPIWAEFLLYHPGDLDQWWVVTGPLVRPLWRGSVTWVRWLIPGQNWNLGICWHTWFKKFSCDLYEPKWTLPLYNVISYVLRDKSFPILPKYSGLKGGGVY